VLIMGVKVVKFYFQKKHFFFYNHIKIIPGIHPVLYQENQDYY